VFRWHYENCYKPKVRGFASEATKAQDESNGYVKAKPEKSGSRSQPSKKSQSIKGEKKDNSTEADVRHHVHQVSCASCSHQVIGKVEFCLTCWRALHENCSVLHKKACKN
jgi:hypothetical protein